MSHKKPFVLEWENKRSHLFIDFSALNKVMVFHADFILNQQENYMVNNSVLFKSTNIRGKNRNWKLADYSWNAKILEFSFSVYLYHCDYHNHESWILRTWYKEKNPFAGFQQWDYWRFRKRRPAAAAKSLQSCLTLCDPGDGSPPGSPVPGILQARTLEWVAVSFSNAWKWKVKGKSLSRVQLFATPWAAAYQSPSMGFTRQEYWSGVPSPSPKKRPRLL